MDYVKIFVFIIAFFCSSTALYAIPSLNISDINQTKELYGPWAFSPEVVTSIDDKRLEKQQLLLPKFIEEMLGTPKGAVTFALSLKTTPNIPLSINLKQPFTVWRLYANGELIGSSGAFNLSTQTYKAQAYYPIASFTPKTDNTTLLLHVANSQLRHIGFYGVPLIAPKGVLEKERLNATYIQFIVVAILAFFGIYHIGLALAWRKDKAPLWFGLLCLSFAVRATTTGEKIVLIFFPDISWEMLTRLEYASGYMALPMFVLYIGALYPKQTSKIAEKIYLFIGTVFVSFVVLLPTLFFTASLPYYEAIVVTFIVYTVWILFQSFFSKEQGSILALSAFLIFSMTVVHDLLMFENIIKTSSDLMPYGFIFYLLAQGMILLLRYTNAFKLIEAHTSNLETLVADRTLELRNLVSQRELLLRELTHRVKNNLQFIIGLLWIQRKEADPKTNTALKTLESQIQSIATVHESLCSQNTITTIEIHDYIRKLILSLKRLHSDLDISLDSHEPIHIQTDHTISLGLIINELITNHIKYANPSQSQPVHIFIEKSLGQNVVLHYNDGIDHRETFEKAQTSSAFGLPKLGWSMIKEFVKQMDATISVYPDHIDLHFLACENI